VPARQSFNRRFIHTHYRPLLHHNVASFGARYFVNKKC